MIYCIDGKIVDKTKYDERLAKFPEVAPEPTKDERLNNVEKRTDALETTTDDMILLMAELIGGN